MKWTQNGIEFEGTVDEYNTMIHEKDINKFVSTKKFKNKNVKSNLYHMLWTPAELHTLKEHINEPQEVLETLIPTRGSQAIMVKRYKMLKAQHKKLNDGLKWVEQSKRMSIINEFANEFMKEGYGRNESLKLAHAKYAVNQDYMNHLKKEKVQVLVTNTQTNEQMIAEFEDVETAKDYIDIARKFDKYSGNEKTYQIQ